MLTYLMVNLSVVLLSATVGAFNNEYESSHRDPDVRERFGGEWHVARFVELRGRTRYRERVDSMAGRARIVINDSLIAFRFANPLVSIDERCNLDSVSLREISFLEDDMNPELRTTTRWFGYASDRGTVLRVSFKCGNREFSFEVLPNDTLVYFYSERAYFFARKP